MATPQPATPQPAAPHPPGRAGNRIQGHTPGKLGVLVVDDEPDIVSLVARHLRRRGHVVFGAEGSDAARRIAEAEPSIGVVLSDVRMPGQDGLGLAADLLRARAEAHALEVILLTGGATTDIAVSALRTGTFDLLHKPPRLEELAAVVERAMDSAQQRRARAGYDAQLQDLMRAADAERMLLAERLAESTGRLSHAEAALGAIHQVRKDLLAVVSHEMRTPLIPLVGFSELIATGMVTDAASLREYGKLMHDGSLRLLRLIEGALDYVLLGQGQPLDRLPPQPAAQVLGPIVQRLSGEAIEKGVTLRVDIAAGLTLAGDLARIGVAVGHLLDNAVKASEPGGTVELTCQGLDGGRSRLDIADRGGGIPPAVAAQVGTPFLQADMSLTRAWPGAGLGLALARRVAEAHGGRLVLAPREGGGTVARLELGPAG